MVSLVSNVLEKSTETAKITSPLFIARSMSSRSLIRIVLPNGSFCILINNDDILSFFRYIGSFDLV